MKVLYLLFPILGYLTASASKFLIHSFFVKKLSLVGFSMGGFPSTHNTITSSLFFAFLLSNRINDENTALAFTLILIVASDSLDFRNQVGRHAHVISKKCVNNELTKKYTRPLVYKSIQVVGGFVLVFLLLFWEHVCLSLKYFSQRSLKPMI